MTTREFVISMINNCREGAEKMTVEQATYDLRMFVNEGWELPEKITAEEYAEIWNELV